MGNKSILMSIQPQWLAKILNGEKTIEIRKKFPKDYVGWVYIYCTKGKEKLFHCKLHVVHNIDGTWMHNQHETYIKYGVAKNLDIFQDNIHENGRHGELDLYDYVEEYEWEDDELNGKVVARFWCDKVEEIKYHPYECTFYTDTVDTIISVDNPVSSFEKASGLSYYDLSDYLYNGKDKIGYAIHISKLEVFDKPNNLRDYVKYDKNHIQIDNCIIGFGFGSCERLTKAPQSYMFVEGEND